MRAAATQAATRPSSITPSETAIRLLRKRRKATVSAERLRSASAAPTSSLVALFSGMRIPMWRSPARSISKGTSACAIVGSDSAATSAGSPGPSEDTASFSGAPLGRTRNAMSLWVSLWICEATASLSR
jgi:hypothetical protein